MRIASWELCDLVGAGGAFGAGELTAALASILGTIGLESGTPSAVFCIRCGSFFGSSNALMQLPTEVAEDDRERPACGGEGACRLKDLFLVSARVIGPAFGAEELTVE